MPGARSLFPAIILSGIAFMTSAQTATPPAAGSPLLNGFDREISGEQIGYRSFHPYARAALLTRCLDGKNPITWQTDPLPEQKRGPLATFAWISGHSSGTSTADARFHLSINGKRWFSFTTEHGRRVRKWTVEGKDGSSLSFDARWEDTVNDLFGYMYLKVPVRSFPKGQPLTISIVGEAANRRDWFMTFTYRLRDSLIVQARPALLKSAAGRMQLVDILIDSREPDDRVEITSPGQASVKEHLALGFNRIQVPVRAVTTETPVTLTIARASGAVRKETVTLRPVTHRELWFLPHSHNDIGYSDLQADVEKKQMKNLRDAVRLQGDGGLPPRSPVQMEQRDHVGGRAVPGDLHPLGARGVHRCGTQGRHRAERPLFQSAHRHLQAGRAPAGHRLRATPRTGIRARDRRRDDLGYPRVHVGDRAGACAGRDQVLFKRAELPTGAP